MVKAFQKSPALHSLRSSDTQNRKSFFLVFHLILLFFAHFRKDKAKPRRENSKRFYRDFSYAMTLSYTLVIRNDMQTPSTEKIYKTINNTLEVINRNLTNIDKKNVIPARKGQGRLGVYVPILEGRNLEKDEVLLLSSLLRIAGKQRLDNKGNDKQLNKMEREKNPGYNLKIKMSMIKLCDITS